MTAQTNLRILYTDFCTLVGMYISCCRQTQLIIFFLIYLSPGLRLTISRGRILRADKVHRDEELIIRGYALAFRSDTKLRPNEDSQKEISIGLPKGYKVAEIKKGFGNRYALAGLLMRDGRVLNFDVKSWQFSPSPCANFDNIVDIDYSLLGELCVLRGMLRTC